MASQNEGEVIVCLVCFEPDDVLKVIGNCEHSFFCASCLAQHVVRWTDSEVFPCPVCKVDCKMSSDTSECSDMLTQKEELHIDADNDMADAANADDDGNVAKLSQDFSRLVNVKCLICHHMGKVVEAEHLCLGCNQLHLCEECTATHKQNKATRHHDVVPLKAREVENVALCVEHQLPLEDLCITCDKPICVVCVSIIHGDHTVKKLHELIQTETAKVKDLLHSKVKEAAELTELKNELAVLDVSPSMERRDTLKETVEGHASRFIDQVIQWKDALKNEIEEDFQVVKDIPKELEMVTKRIAKLKLPVSKGSQLILEPKNCSSHLAKLISVEHELSAQATDFDRSGGEKCKPKLYCLAQEKPIFVPKMFCDLGKLKKEVSHDFSRDFNPKSIFKHEIVTCSASVYIPCIANLGEYFAIAHPVSKFEPAKSVDIYKFPWDFVQTIVDGVTPIYDMCSTSDGKLAVLSAGNEHLTWCIKTCDVESSDIISTFEINGLYNPFSFDTSISNQYVILSGLFEQKTLSVVSQNRRVECEHMFRKDDKIGWPRRVTVGGRFVFVIGSEGVIQFDLTSLGLWKIRFIARPSMIAISATMWDVLLWVCIAPGSGSLFLGCCRKNRIKQMQLIKNANKAEEFRIAAGDSSIVVSQGNTFQVFNY